MDDSIKYLIHARITADGVVERTDVVGAIFGQTEGLLGEELEIRGLQDSAKLGRIDVKIESENGRSFGRVTIGSNLDKVETAILGAALETIDQVGPCVASIEVTRIQDVRAAKRRQVAERAKELLESGFDEALLSSAEILDQVRESMQSAVVDEYADLPAGPAVEDGDAVIVVEGRSDVRRLLEFGIKNAVAVEGTNVPDAVADLTRGRTATAFLDGDRGGDLILRELAQVGDIEYVARAPSGRSVEDLSREDVRMALQEKRSLERALRSLERGDEEGTAYPAREFSPTTDNDSRETPSEDATEPSVTEIDRDRPEADGSPTDTDRTIGRQERERGLDHVDQGKGHSDGGIASEAADPAGGTETRPAGDRSGADPSISDVPGNVSEHAAAVIGSGTGRGRLLDADASVIEEVPADDVAATLAEGAEQLFAVVVDATVGQPVLDEAATRGVQRIVASDRGEIVKSPADLRLHTWAEVSASEQPPADDRSP